MCSLRFPSSASSRKAAEGHLKTAQHLGHLRQVTYLLPILAVLDGQSFAQVALVLRVREKTMAPWGHVFCCSGLQGAPRPKPPGRPPQRTPTAKAALATARRPSVFCNVHGLPHTWAGAHHPTHLPEAGWSKVSHQHGDQSLFRPTDRTASGVPVADLFTRLQPD